jgi:hypothetical protein
MYSLGCFICMKFILHSNYRICCTVITYQFCLAHCFATSSKVFCLQSLYFLTVVIECFLFVCGFICQFDIFLSVVLEMQYSNVYWTVQILGHEVPAEPKQRVARKMAHK